MPTCNRGCHRFGVARPNDSSECPTWLVLLACILTRCQASSPHPCPAPPTSLCAGATNALTRRAGGRSLRPLPKRVVVDVREFMSSLPSVLHQQVSTRGVGDSWPGLARQVVEQ